MTLGWICFTDGGQALAERLAAVLGGQVSRCGKPQSLAEWTAENFARREGLVYVGAAGIAVRAVAPHLTAKAHDPAVVAVDECGKFAVALASGHLGGANRLAEEIGRCCGAVPVITTATDRRGVFAVDSWAKEQGCVVCSPEKIKRISGALLAGGTVCLASDWPIAGQPPAGVVLCEGEADIRITLRREENALWLAPRALVLGVGCKRNTPAEIIEAAVQALLAENGYRADWIAAAASIDLKRDEPGLRAVCRAHGWPLFTATAGELAALPGEFTPSAFVQGVTGVDNVCERAAVLAGGGALLVRKTARNGVTLALALRPVALAWPE